MVVRWDDPKAPADTRIHKLKLHPKRQTRNPFEGSGYVDPLRISPFNF